MKFIPLRSTLPLVVLLSSGLFVSATTQAAGFETLWELHYSDEGGSAHNTSEQYIANIQGSEVGHYLEVRASKEGSFDVLNSRTNFVQMYPSPR